jgi:hypothetical protein
MSFYRVMQVMDGVSTRIGRVFTDLEQAIRFAAKQPLRLQARVVEQEVGNEVWPAVRGYTSSIPPADPEHLWAQLVSAPKEVSPFPVYNPNPILTEQGRDYAPAKASDSGRVTGARMVWMGSRLRP